MALTPEDIRALQTALETVVAPLTEQVARLESRVAALTASVQGMATRMITVEITLQELTDRLARMSANDTRARTADVARLADFEKRLVALETIFAQDRG
jgi:hypothetical protein